MIEMHVTADHVRPFVQLLGCCSRMCDYLFIEPSPRSVLLRAVNRAKSTHLLVAIPHTFFAKYSWGQQSSIPVMTNDQRSQFTSQQQRIMGAPLPHTVGSLPNSATAPSQRPLQQSGGGAAAAAAVTDPTAVIPSLCLESKALLSSLLRPSCSSFSQISIMFNPNTHADTVELLTHSSFGVRRTYTLHLQDTPSQQAAVSDQSFVFTATADPKAWMSIGNSFPPATQRITIQPGPARLTLQTADEYEGPRGAVISIDSAQFSDYKYSLLGGDGDGGGQCQTPGKKIEYRPLRSFMFFADQLQMKVRLRCGGAAVPVQLEAIERGATEQQQTSLVSHLSLLIAAIDVVAPPPTAPVSFHHHSSSDALPQPTGGVQSTFIVSGGATPLSTARSSRIISAEGEDSTTGQRTSWQQQQQQQGGGGSVTPSGLYTPASALKRPRGEDKYNYDSGGVVASSEARSHVSLTNPASSQAGGARADAYATGLFPLDFTAMGDDDEEEEDARYDAFVKGMWDEVGVATTAATATAADDDGGGAPPQMIVRSPPFHA